MSSRKVVLFIALLLNSAFSQPASIPQRPSYDPEPAYTEDSPPCPDNYPDYPFIDSSDPPESHSRPYPLDPCPHCPCNCPNSRPPCSCPEKFPPWTIYPLNPDHNIPSPDEYLQGQDQIFYNPDQNTPSPVHINRAQFPHYPDHHTPSSIHYPPKRDQVPYFPESNISPPVQCRPDRDEKPVPICPDQKFPIPDNYQPGPDRFSPYPNPDPYPIYPFPDHSSDSGIVEVRPCDPSLPPVKYIYGQAPYGSLIVKPGTIRFPKPEPIIVKPGTIKPPTPPVICVKPPPVHPPQPQPIRVQPEPVHPMNPQPIVVRPQPVTPPIPEPIIVRPPPVVCPRGEKFKVTPPKLQPPRPEVLLLTPAKISLTQPPTICFRPNPPTFKNFGSAEVSFYKPCHCSCPETEDDS